MKFYLLGQIVWNEEAPFTQGGAFPKGIKMHLQGREKKSEVFWGRGGDRYTLTDVKKIGGDKRASPC